MRRRYGYQRRARTREAELGARAQSQVRAQDNQNLAYHAHPDTAPKPKPVAGPPVDPQLEAYKASAQNNLRLGGIWDTYATGQINTGYGNLDNPTADLASNPYSRAALLQQSYNNQKRGTLNSYAGQGQLYSGALQNQAESDLSGFNQGLDALKKERQGSLDEILKGGLDRYSQVGAELNSETLEAILRALRG